MRFKGKTVVVTGAAGGIGVAIARRFASEGAATVLADISLQKLEQVAKLVQGESSIVPLLTACDVSNEQQVESAINTAIKHFGSVDIIVNNAGLMIFKK